jgi:hypothetical protein
VNAQNGNGNGGANGANADDETCGLSPAVLARLCPNGEPVPDCIKKLEAHLVERICNESALASLASIVSLIAWLKLAALVVLTPDPN